jgi:hypothetical protein
MLGLRDAAPLAWRARCVLGADRERRAATGGARCEARRAEGNAMSVAEEKPGAGTWVFLAVAFMASPFLAAFVCADIYGLVAARVAELPRLGALEVWTLALIGETMLVRHGSGRGSARASTKPASEALQIAGATLLLRWPIAWLMARAAWAVFG